MCTSGGAPGDASARSLRSPARGASGAVRRRCESRAMGVTRAVGCAEAGPATGGLTGGAVGAADRRLSTGTFRTRSRCCAGEFGTAWFGVIGGDDSRGRASPSMSNVTASATLIGAGDSLRSRAVSTGAAIGAGAAGCCGPDGAFDAASISAASSTKGCTAVDANGTAIGRSRGPSGAARETRLRRYPLTPWPSPGTRGAAAVSLRECRARPSHRHSRWRALLPGVLPPR